MSNQISLRELQLEELEILRIITKYIDAKNLKYYRSGGTLLGAVRHKWFIPWDDDIDIIMPRNDYEKLMQFLKKEPLKEENLKAVSFELNNSNRPFGKIINTDISIESKSKEDRYLWIDIFPIDGLPDDREKAIKHIKSILKYKGMIYLKATTFKEIKKEKKSLMNRYLKIVLKFITLLIPIKYCAKRINKLAKRYDYGSSKYVGTTVWPDGEKSIQERKWHKDTVNFEFEGYEFNAFVGWREYLITMYGDYMKLPPEVERINHQVKASRNGK